MNGISKNLKFALSEIADRFGKEPAKLHFALSLIISSILKNSGYRCCIVGGQAAAYWMRITGSTDADFVTEKTSSVAEILCSAGFAQNNDRKYLYTHQGYSMMVELVGEEIEIAGVRSDRTVEIQTGDIIDENIKRLMPGPAEVIDPVLVFLNYLDASQKDSVWFDSADDGKLSGERAKALFELYGNYLVQQFRVQDIFSGLPLRLLDLLREEYGISKIK